MVEEHSYRFNTMNVDGMFPPLIGDKVIVRVPEGLPGLMMDVARQIIREPATDEIESYSTVADYLERLLKEKRGKDDVIDMVTRLIKTDEERYVDGLKESGHTDDELNNLANVIQQGWKRFKSLHRKPSKTNDNTMTTGDVIKMVESYGVSLKTANEAAIKIQRAWKKNNFAAESSKQFKTEFLDEIDYEDDSDDMERVNVVKKGQRDYVPPIPDYIDDLDSLKDRRMVNIIDQFRRSSYEEE